MARQGRLSAPRGNASGAKVVVALLLLPFFTYAIGYKWPLLGSIVMYSRYVIIAGLIVRSLATDGFSKLLLCKSFRWLLITYLILVISSLVNHQSLFNVLQLCMYGVIPYMVLVNRSDAGDALGGANLALLIVIVLNAIIMLVYPDGIYQTYSSNKTTAYYLFGSKNQMVAPILFGAFIFIEYSYYAFGAISVGTILKVGLCGAELLIGGSGTGIAGFMLMIFVIIIQIIIKKNIRPSLMLCAVAAVFILFVLIRAQSIFSFLIENILGKTLDLSNRTTIWDEALGLFSQSPLIGYGVSSSLAGQIQFILGFENVNTFAHNIVLDFLIMGGLPALISFVLFLVNSYKEYLHSTFITRRSVLWDGFCVYLLISLFDIYPGNLCLYIAAGIIACEAARPTLRRFDEKVFEK